MLLIGPLSDPVGRRGAADRRAGHLRRRLGAVLAGPQRRGCCLAFAVRAGVLYVGVPVVIGECCRARPLLRRGRVAPVLVAHSLAMAVARILAPWPAPRRSPGTWWRGIFVALAVLAALIALLVAFGLEETLPPERRSTHGLGHTLQTMRGLLRDRWFVGHALAGSLGFGALFAYVAGSRRSCSRMLMASHLSLQRCCFVISGVGSIPGKPGHPLSRRPLRPAAHAARGAARDRRGLGDSAGRCALIGGLLGRAVQVRSFMVVSSLPFVLPNSMALALLADHAAVARQGLGAARRVSAPSPTVVGWGRDAERRADGFLLLPSSPRPCSPPATSPRARAGGAVA